MNSRYKELITCFSDLQVLCVTFEHIAKILLNLEKEKDSKAISLEYEQLFKKQQAIRPGLIELAHTVSDHVIHMILMVKKNKNIYFNYGAWILDELSFMLNSLMKKSFLMPQDVENTAILLLYLLAVKKIPFYENYYSPEVFRNAHYVVEKISAIGSVTLPPHFYIWKFVSEFKHFQSQFFEDQYQQILLFYSFKSQKELKLSEKAFSKKGGEMEINFLSNHPALQKIASSAKEDFQTCLKLLVDGDSELFSKKVETCLNAYKPSAYFMGRLFTGKADIQFEFLLLKALDDFKKIDRNKFISTLKKLYEIENKEKLANKHSVIKLLVDWLIEFPLTYESSSLLLSDYSLEPPKEKVYAFYNEFRESWFRKIYQIKEIAEKLFDCLLEIDPLPFRDAVYLYVKLVQYPLAYQLPHVVKEIQDRFQSIMTKEASEYFDPIHAKELEALFFSMPEGDVKIKKQRLRMAILYFKSFIHAIQNDSQTLTVLFHYIKKELGLIYSGKEPLKYIIDEILRPDDEFITYKAKIIDCLKLNDFFYKLSHNEVKEPKEKKALADIFKIHACSYHLLDGRAPTINKILSELIKNYSVESILPLMFQYMRLLPLHDYLFCDRLYGSFLELTLPQKAIDYIQDRLNEYKPKNASRIELKRINDLEPVEPVEKYLTEEEIIHQQSKLQSNLDQISPDVSKSLMHLQKYEQMNTDHLPYPIVESIKDIFLKLTMICHGLENLNQRFIEDKLSFAENKKILEHQYQVNNKLIKLTNLLCGCTANFIFFYMKKEARTLGLLHGIFSSTMDYWSWYKPFFKSFMKYIEEDDPKNKHTILVNQGALEAFFELIMVYEKYRKGALEEAVMDCKNLLPKAKIKPLSFSKKSPIMNLYEEMNGAIQQLNTAQMLRESFFQLNDAFSVRLHSFKNNLETLVIAFEKKKEEITLADLHKHKTALNAMQLFLINQEIDIQSLLRHKHEINDVLEKYKKHVINYQVLYNKREMNFNLYEELFKIIQDKKELIAQEEKRIEHGIKLLQVEQKQQAALEKKENELDKLYHEIKNKLEISESIYQKSLVAIADLKGYKMVLNLSSLKKRNKRCEEISNQIHLQKKSTEKVSNAIVKSKNQLKKLNNQSIKKREEIDYGAEFEAFQKQNESLNQKLLSFSASMDEMNQNYYQGIQSLLKNNLANHLALIHALEEKISGIDTFFSNVLDEIKAIKKDNLIQPEKTKPQILRLIAHVTKCKNNIQTLLTEINGHVEENQELNQIIDFLKDEAKQTIDIQILFNMTSTLPILEGYASRLKKSTAFIEHLEVMCVELTKQNENAISFNSFGIELNTSWEKVSTTYQNALKAVENSHLLVDECRDLLDKNEIKPEHLANKIDHADIQMKLNAKFLNGCYANICADLKSWNAIVKAWDKINKRIKTLPPFVGIINQMYDYQTQLSRFCSDATIFSFELGNMKEAAVLRIATHPDPKKQPKKKRSKQPLFADFIPAVLPKDAFSLEKLTPILSEEKIFILNRLYELDLCLEELGIYLNIKGSFVTLCAMYLLSLKDLIPSHDIDVIIYCPPGKIGICQDILVKNHFTQKTQDLTTNNLPAVISKTQKPTFYEYQLKVGKDAMDLDLVLAVEGYQSTNSYPLTAFTMKFSRKNPLTLQSEEKGIPKGKIALEFNEKDFLFLLAHYCKFKIFPIILPNPHDPHLRGFFSRYLKWQTKGEFLVLFISDTGATCEYFNPKRWQEALLYYLRTKFSDSHLKAGLDIIANFSRIVREGNIGLEKAKPLLSCLCIALIEKHLNKNKKIKTNEEVKQFADQLTDFLQLFFKDSSLYPHFKNVIEYLVTREEMNLPTSSFEQIKTEVNPFIVDIHSLEYKKHFSLFKSSPQDKLKKQGIDLINKALDQLSKEKDLQVKLNYFDKIKIELEKYLKQDAVTQDQIDAFIKFVNENYLPKTRHSSAHRKH